MKNLIPKLDDLRQSTHPREFAALVHKEFVFIHPFIDSDFINFIAQMVKETQKDYLRLFV